MEAKTGQTIHEKAAKGFEIAGDAYERGRPDYPASAIEYLLHCLDVRPGSVVADLGAGTGKFTKLLGPSRARIIAVEPVEGMRKKFASLYPDIEIRSGTAETIPLEDEEVDAVVAAQAFHWFDGKKALREIHRVLKSAGGLGLIWNARDESVDWVARLTDIIDPHEGGAPRFKSMKWIEAFNDQPLFSPLEHRAFRHEQVGTHDTIVNRIASISFISALAPEVNSDVLNEVRSLLALHSATRGRTQLTLSYVTHVYWTKRQG